MSQALEGEHYCQKHQGNHSHYADHNCTVCKLETELAEVKALAQAVVEDANIEPDTGWELPSYCHVERSEILALAALLGGEDGN